MVADPDPGKSEGGDSREVRRVGGGGWAEDMEGRSGLTLLLHTPVLSLTLVYIIFLVCSSQQLRCRTRTGSHQERPHTGHGRHRCDFFIIRKVLGKGGGSGIIRVPGYFLFFFPDPKREVTQGTIFWCRIQDHFWCRIRDYFCFVLLTFTY
jgi:hypothetical protein